MIFHIDVWIDTSPLELVKFSVCVRESVCVKNRDKEKERESGGGGGGGGRMVEGVILFGAESFHVFCANKAPLKCYILHNFLLPLPSSLLSSLFSLSSLLLVVIVVSHWYFVNDFHLKFLSSLLE